MGEKKTVAIAVLCVAMVLCQGLWANAAKEAARTSSTLLEEKTYFLPSLHGWPFPNDFHFKGKLKEFLGYWVPFSNIIKLDGKVGFCGGMGFAALDRFYRAEYISDSLQLPRQGEPLYEEIRQRLMNSLPRYTIDRIHNWQSYDDEEVGYRTELEGWDVKASIEAGHPVQLLLVSTRGWKYSTLIDNHQVIAYRYAIDEVNKRFEIGIYDPNYPDNNDVSISYSYEQPKHLIKASQSTGETLRGFFIINYDKDPPTPTINTLVYDGWSHVEDFCFIRGERRGLFRIKFHWSCNFIPFFTMKRNNDIFNITDPDTGIQQLSENIEAKEAKGSYENEIWVKKGLEDSYYQPIDLFFVSQENHIVFPIEFVPPAIEAHPFIHSMNQRYGSYTINALETMIADAKLRDVVIVYPNDEPFSDDELNVRDYWDRRVYVEGGIIDHSSGQLPTMMRFVMDYKLGYVTAHIRCEVEEEGLVGTINREGESYLIDPADAYVIPIIKIDAKDIDIQSPTSFFICYGFSGANYDQDHVLIFNYKATDQASQVAEGQLKIYAKSLLCIQYTEIGDLRLPNEWESLRDRIHEKVDVSGELVVNFPVLPIQIQQEISSFIKEPIMVERVNQELEQLDTDSAVWNQISQSNMQIYNSIKNELDALLYTEANYYEAMIKAEKLKLELTTRTTENTARILANEIDVKIESEFINILLDTFARARAWRIPR